MNSVVRNRKVYFVISFIFFCATKNGSARVHIPNLPQKEYHRDGDLLIGHLMGIHSYDPNGFCSEKFRSYTRMMYVEGVVFALEEVNKRQDILPNITLGFTVFDDCSKDLTALARVLYLLPNEIKVNGTLVPEEKERRYQISGFIGPSSSTKSVMAAPVSSIVKIPLLSSFATADELSDKSRFEYFVRMVPPDRFQVEALADFVHKMNWTYVSFLYSEGAYGEGAARHMKRKLKEKNICFAFLHQVSIDANEDEFRFVAEQLQSYMTARVIITFMERHNYDGLFELLNRDYSHLQGHFLWTGGDNLSPHYYKPFANGGIRSLFPLASIGPEFTKKYYSLTPWNHTENPWMVDLWQYLFKCSWDVAINDTSSCHQYESLNDAKYRTVTRWSSMPMDAATTYGYALDALIRAECPDAFADKSLLKDCIQGDLLLAYLKNTTFQGRTGEIKFDSNGDSIRNYDFQFYNGKKSVTIGHWSKETGETYIDFSLIDWYLYVDYRNITPSGQVPGSFCSYPCGRKEYQVVMDPACCWECRTCRNNEYLLPNDTGCEVCPELSWPDSETGRLCETIPPTYLKWSDGLSLGVGFSTSIGFIVAVVITALFFRNGQNKLIKATSKDLSGLILLGVALAFLVVFTFLARPSTVTCLISRLGFNFAVTLTYAPLLAKTMRIYRIFASAKNGTTKPRFISSAFQLLLTGFLIILQIILSVSSLLLAPPIAKFRMQVPTEKHVELFCNLPLDGLLVPLVFNITLILLCAVFGFLTRKLPENFNESWHIFISVMTTSFLWMVFLPTYFTQFYAYNQAALLAFCLLMNSAITLLCLYVPKLYAVYYVDQKKIKFATQATAVSVVPM